MFNWNNYPYTLYNNMKYFKEVYKYIIDLDDMINQYGYRYHIMMDIDCPVCTDYYIV